MAALDIAAWQADSLRLTIFGTEVLAPANSDWWQKLTKSIPHSVGSRPQQGEYFEAGSFLDGNLEIKTAFNRLDCVLSAPASMSGYPALDGNIEELVDSFLSLVVPWVLELGFPIIRVAFGITCMHAATERIQANEIIMDHVQGLSVNASEAHDLFIQVAYPHSSKVLGGVLIHPLAKWLSMKVQLFTMNPGNVSLPALSSKSFCRAEFDVYTPFERMDTIPAVLIKDLCLELAASALSTLKGDRC